MTRPTLIGLMLAVAFGAPLLLLGQPYGLPAGLFLMGLVVLVWSLLRRDRIALAAAAFLVYAGIALLLLGRLSPMPASLAWLTLVAGLLGIAAALWRRRSATRQ